MELPVNVSLKAEAKASVSATIPEASTGRLVDCLTDIIRPFSEKRGLKADIIRLQREDVAHEIAKRANERLTFLGLTPQPIDTKIFVPLLERGSCENPSDNEMIDRWATLLANCSANADDIRPRFVQILGEITAAQARMLQQVALNPQNRRESIYISPVSSEPNEKIIQRLDLIEKNPEERDFSENIIDVVRQVIDIKGNAIVRIVWYYHKNRQSLNIFHGPCVEHGGGKNAKSHRESTVARKYENHFNQVDAQVLMSLSLISHKIFKMRIPGQLAECYKNNSLLVEYYYLTQLGGTFLSAVDDRVSQYWPKRKINFEDM